MIRLEQITKSFGSLQVLRGIASRYRRAKW